MAAQIFALKIFKTTVPGSSYNLRPLSQLEEANSIALLGWDIWVNLIFRIEVHSKC